MWLVSTVPDNVDIEHFCLVGDSIGQCSESNFMATSEHILEQNSYHYKCVDLW